MLFLLEVFGASTSTLTGSMRLLTIEDAPLLGVLIDPLGEEPIAADWAGTIAFDLTALSAILRSSF